MHRIPCGIFCCVLLAALSSFAANTQPQCTTWGDFFVGSQYYTVPASCSAFDVYGGNTANGFHAVAGGGTSPSISFEAWAYSNVSPGGSTNGTWSGNFGANYWVNIWVPGGANGPVPVGYAYSGGISGTAAALGPTSDAQFGAHLNVDTTGDLVWWNSNSSCDNGPWSYCSGINWTQSHYDQFYIPANTWFEFKLGVDGVASVDNIGHTDFTVFIDPTLTLGAAWLAAHPGAYIMYSVPASATPEPLSLVLFGTGIAGVVGAIRRRLAG